MQLTCHSLKQCTAPSPRPAEDDEKLSAVDDAVHLVQDSSMVLLVETQELAQADRGGDPVGDGALQLQGVTLSRDSQVPEGDAGLGWGDALSAHETDNVLEILAEIEGLARRVHGRVRGQDVGSWPGLLRVVSSGWCRSGANAAHIGSKTLEFPLVLLVHHGQGVKAVDGPW